MSEKHEYQFTGIFIPKHIVQLFDIGDISIREMFLLGIISALAKDEGCYASNGYLGRKLGVTGNYINKMLARLKELDLVQIRQREDGSRVMKTYFNSPQKWDSQLLPAAEGGPTPVGGGSAARRTPSPLKEGTELEEDNCGLRPQPDGFGLRRKEWEEKAASVLINALTSKRLLMRQANLKAWALEFRAMLKQGVPKDELKETLLWYCENLQRKYVPEAYSAKAFRDKYPRIRSRMQAAKQEAREEVLVKPDELSRLERAIYDQLAVLFWPKGSKELLPAAIQQSVASFRTYAKRADALPQSGVMGKFNRWMRAAHFASPAVCLENHFRAVWERVKGWDDWSGNLLAYAWAPDIKPVQQHGKELATAYGSDPALYTRYLEALGYAS